MKLYDQYGRELEEGDLVIPADKVLDVFRIAKMDLGTITKPGQPPLISMVLVTERLMQIQPTSSKLITPLVFVGRPPKETGVVMQ